MATLTSYRDAWDQDTVIRFTRSVAPNPRSFRDTYVAPPSAAIFRARVGSEYVYFTGTAPVGATDIVVVSPTGG